MSWCSSKRVEEEDVLKTHILIVQEEAYKVILTLSNTFTWCPIVDLRNYFPNARAIIHFAVAL